MLSTWFKNKNMKSSGQKEEPEDKRKYVFFSDPDVVAKRAETSAITAQIKLDLETQRQTIENQLTHLQTSSFDIKSLENLLSYHPVQPYPFPFISAVKQKLALGDCINTGSKTYDPNSQAKSLTSSVLKAKGTQNLCQIVQKMDYIKPLKVPDLKISPKTLDFSSRDNSVSKELPSTKSEIIAKEFAHDRSDRTLRTGDKVQRKLDFFFPDGSSIINCENIEPLKAPNVSIASNLCKKKDHVRDSSREKENKSKRMKKDDSLCAKRDESVREHTKRSRSPRHISRKDSSNISNVRVQNDKSFHATKNNDFLSMKLKDKNVLISTAKKDNDKRQKFFNAQSVELKDNSIDSKGRVSSSEPLVISSDKVTLRDNNNSVSCNNTETKSKDICHMLQRSEIENLKSDSDISNHTFDLDNRQLKEDKSNSIYKEQIKRVFDKNKILSSRLEGKQHNINSEQSEDIGSMSETNSSKNCVYHINSMPPKSKDLEMVAEIKQNINFARSIKTDELKYAEHSEAHLTSTSTKKNEESYSQSVGTSKETTTNDDSNNVDVSSTLPEALFDPRRISFRDGYSQQEFNDLITPEKINLVKTKRRRNLIPSSDSEVDARCPKYKPTVKSEKEQEEGQLMHPKALHKQFQAELQLYETFNESLRQVIDVEKCLYNTKCEQEKKNLQKNEELEKIIEDGCIVSAVDSNTVEKARNLIDYSKKNVTDIWRSSDEAHFNGKYYVPTNQTNVVESAIINYGNKAAVKVAEVQAKTVHDIATQTKQKNTQNKLSEIIEKLYEQSSSVENDIAEHSLNSIEQFENLDQIEDISVPSRIRTMSEISLHETTSSIKTETGTEISISTRDVTFSINQYLDLEIEQLIRDENHRCNKMEELLKSREKTLSDKTKKLMQLEEQKRALRDTGQDSRSVKKKQRALLLKLQQEAEYLCKIKKLHQQASQERMDMLRKQRNMFNPEMSTRNILTKLKRSADSQSPRRLSGPMKGYDIRSNSSRSSVIESDKSQHDCSNIEPQQGSESDVHSIKLDLIKSDDVAKNKELREKDPMSPKRSDISMHELRSRKYEEKMPRADILQRKQNQRNMESKRIQVHPMNIKRLLENQESSIGTSKIELINASVLDHVKSESDTIVEELSKKSKTSQAVDLSMQTATVAKEKDSTSNIITASNESIEEEINTIAQDTVSKTTQSSQISEDILQTNTSKSSKKIDKSVMSDRDISKKSQYNDELTVNSKHKNFKYQKMKSSSNTLTENILQSKSSSRLSNELKHQDKRIQLEHELLHLDSNNKSSILGELDFNVSQELLQTPVKHSKLIKDKNLKLSETPNNYKSKENVFSQINRKLEHDESCRNKQNTSTSQISTFAISHRSSKESEKNLSKSVVVRSQDRHLEQILIARETALASRKNCIKEWMAWHARLRAEEDRVNRMEQAAFKLVATYSNVLNQQDSTISSDTSDVEGRIGYLTEKLEERRIEMARLKREAKKETKKQLRALEANLLNQIKKYDMTIHEMRKKLETKKTKETDKLAIEPKSLAEFKVPEIPLKRIQNIYKSSDLLRSKSESDLLITRNQQKDPLKGLLFTTPITYDDKYEKNSSKKSIKYTDTKSTNISESNDTNQIVSDRPAEYTSTEVYDKIRTTSILSTTNDAHLEKYVLSKEMQIEESGITRTKQSSISSSVEDVETNLDTAKSESEVRTLSDARSVDHSTINTESTNNGLMTNVDRSQPKTNLSIQSEIQEIGNDSIKSVSSKSNYSTESTARTVADSDILTYSKKLDFLQLNNKNLSEDISAIENGIKVFSEIMSRLNESNEKSKINDERNTSQDISEIISKSVFSDKIVDIANEEKHTTSGETNTDSLSILTNNEKSKSPKSNDLSHDNNKSDEINSEISAIISEEVQLSDLDREIDYEAKSKEIMNEIEKSIISEQIKIVHDDYNAVTSVSENKDKDLLNDLASELEVKSISEIFSKMSESRRNIDRATTTATQIIDDSRKRINERSVNLNKEKLEKDFVKDQTEETYSLKFSERPHSPIIAGHCSKENSETQSNLQSVHSAVPSQVLHVAASEDSKSSDNIPEMLEAETGIDMRILKNLDEDVETSTVFDHSKHSMVLSSNANQNQSHAISTENISQDRDNWLTSDSFQIPQDEVSTGERNENSKSHVDHTNNASNNFSKKNVETRCVDDATKLRPEVEINLANNINESACIPKEESTKVEMHDITFNNILTESHVMKSNDELDDILDIIARENNRGESIPNKESEKLDNVISDSMTELLEKVKDIVENDGGSVDNHFKGILCDIGVNDETEVVSDFSSFNKAQNKTNVENITESNVDFPSMCNDNKSSNSEKIMDISLQAVGETGDKSAVRVNVHVEIDNEESSREAIPEIQEIIITELDSDSVEDNVLSELEIDAKVELAEEEESTASCVSENENRYTVKEKKDIIEIKECLESILEQDSSDGEQLDNLVEVAESGLDTVEKVIASPRDFPVIDNTIFVDEKTTEKTDDTAGKDKIITISDTPVNENLNKTFDILKDPEYEDISEESLEVSEILDKTDFPKAGIARKSSNLPDKYQATQKSEEVLRILDEISQRSSDSISNSQKNEKSAAQSETQEEISELLDAEVSAEDDSPSSEMKKITRSKVEEKSYKVDDESRNRFLKEVELHDEQPSMEAISDIGSPEEKDRAPLRLDADDDDKSTRIAYELQEQDGSSGESSEAGDTPRGVSDIEMDSPRDFNDSRLDIDILDDDLLSDTKAMTNQNDVKTNFHSSSIVATSENDITAMINKLKASLEQPGQEVAELQAKLLRIEQLQIELEIKKLEAEEVSFYVREIPNKPPPPYTPPGDGRLSASLGSPSMTPAVIPSNVEELTSFTEKATVLIYNAKQAGEDIANLEAPVEIYDSIKDKINENKDRRIYNTFLFDLCKEIIVEVFRAEYEKPGPSWTKPNVKTKPAMKIPKTVEDLVEYVNQEVATLFGFKTKLQRENMVMRWSRKRRDRVDELLAREAQAEEDEWTKFHHDELVVKNGLTVAILDTLMMETANIVKIAYGKKRRIMV